MAERQLPKLHTGVRFPSPAFFHWTLDVQRWTFDALPKRKSIEPSRGDAHGAALKERLFQRDAETSTSRRVRSLHHGPPKSLRNDLNKRPGKVAAFSGKPGTWFANGHCAPPCTWQAAVGTLSAGKSIS